jgi:hypothetical protein
MDDTQTVPVLLDVNALRQRLKPHLKPTSFHTWLQAAIVRYDFPQGLRLGERTRAWRADEVVAWLESRARGGRFDGRRRTRGAAA